MNRLAMAAPANVAKFVENMIPPGSAAALLRRYQGAGRGKMITFIHMYQTYLGAHPHVKRHP